MDSETKKPLIGGGIIAAGLVAASAVFQAMSPEQPQVEKVDKQEIVRSVTEEVTKGLKDKKPYVEVPDAVHADTMVFLNAREEKVDAKVAEQDKAIAKLLTAVETLAKAPESDERLLKAIETLAKNQQVLEKSNEALSKSVSSVSNRMSFSEKAMEEDLTRVFEGFDRRFNQFEGNVKPTVTMPNNRGGALRMVSDPASSELDERLANIEALLATKVSDDKKDEDPEGINVNWGDPVVEKLPVHNHPAPPLAKPEEPKDKGLVRTLAGATGDTVVGGTDIAVDTVTNATGVAGQLVKDLTRTATTAVIGTSDTAGEAIGGTGSLVKKQGKRAWSKFW